jgi:hypothetical protein
MGVIGVLGVFRQRGCRETLLGVTLVLVVLAAPVHGAVTDAGHGDAATARPTADVAGNNSSSANLSATGFDLGMTGASGSVAFEAANPYVWTASDQTTEVHVRAPANSKYQSYQVCLSVVDPGSGSERQVGCQQFAASGGVDETVTMTWTATDTGPRELAAELVGTSDAGSQVIARNVSQVHLMKKTGDVDNDKLPNAKELEAGTNLTDTDTDDDGLLDGAEVTEYETDPLDADTDDDGVRDAVEIQQGTDPTASDTDGDGLTDGQEVEGETDPTEQDSDADGVDDSTELEMGTNPTDPDTDGDGLTDGQELAYGSEPTLVDSDGDLFTDGLERQLGTDPAATWSPALFVAFALGVLVTSGVAMLRRRRERDDDANAEAASEDAQPEDGEAEDAPLTDRDRILQLLKGAGGQLKQTRIVEETEWSKAKVSRVLSQMEADGEISKIRIGRENLICIKGNEPDLAQPSI